MRYSGKLYEVASPPAKRRTAPTEQTDEASGLIENEQVEIEREAPLEQNESIERVEPRDKSDPPAFED